MVRIIADDGYNAALGSAYILVPYLFTVFPNEGPEVGGTEIILGGYRFTGATGVLFGATPGTVFSVADDETILVTSPAGTAGCATLTVQHPNGDRTFACAFYYGTRPE